MDLKRWSTWLLVGLLALQGWNLSKLSRRLDQSQARLGNLENYYNSRISGLEATEESGGSAAMAQPAGHYDRHRP